jgi:hypothetical protein
VEDEDEFCYDAIDIAKTRKTILKQRAHKRNNANILFAAGQNQEQLTELMRNNFLEERGTVNRSVELLMNPFEDSNKDFTQKRIICDLDEIQRINEDSIE